MTSIQELMTRDHRACDDCFSDAERAVDHGDWAAAEAAWLLFGAVLDNHITGLEEELLFPAFESRNGETGPTQVMRMEHGQIRTLVESMQQALSWKDAHEFLGLAETLMILLQQHNMKEEQILYPLMDRSLARPDEIASLLRRKLSPGHTLTGGHPRGG